MTEAMSEYAARKGQEKDLSAPQLPSGNTARMLNNSLTFMRSTKKVSTWPVGLVGGLMVETPLVKDGKVVGFNADFAPKRKYAADMASFAVSVELLVAKSHVWFSYKYASGHQETEFVSRLINIKDLEPKAENCSKYRVQLIFGAKIIPLIKSYLTVLQEKIMFQFSVRSSSDTLESNRILGSPVGSSESMWGQDAFEYRALCPLHYP
ncbi:Galactosylgalactosylxylosylprotein 3-beta-glucuronosyltransferase 3 [Nymphon striatum]|nr:Galactosylgalactosylxylosylprotein 3-beta-glucuronosyltransferase 3 [Nymphon striatum]